MFIVDKKIENYCRQHTDNEPDVLQELVQETQDKMEYHRMLTGQLGGRFLKMLAQLTQAKHVVEIGMFTGYSALSLAEGMAEDGRIVTCEVDPEAAAIANKYFAKSPYGHKIDVRMGPALETLQTIEGPIDLVFIDADKVNYSNYYNAILPKVRSGGLIVVDNCLWSGRVLEPEDEATESIAALNQLVSQDDRVEKVLLTIRDGIFLIRKK